MSNPTGLHRRSIGHWGWVPFVVAIILIFSPLGSPGGQGLKGKTWWDWLDLAGVPATLAGFGFWFQYQQRRRDAEEKVEQRENAALTEFIKSMQPLLLDKNLKESPKDAEVRGVARALTLATLSQLESEESPARKSLVIRFLLDSGLNAKPGNLFNLSGADLSGADLSGANLSGADLSGADLSGADLGLASLNKADLNKADLNKASLNKADLNKANLGGATLIGASLGLATLSEANLSLARLNQADLRGANLIGAILIVADLRGATLIWANLSGADLEDIKWDKKTRWPGPEAFKDARNISKALRQQLGL